RWRFEHDFEVLVTQSIAGGDALETDERGDVTGESGFNVNAFVCLNHHDPADALAFACAWVVNDVALFELATIDAEENELADVRIRPELESEGTEFGIVIGLDLDLVSAVGDNAGCVWDVQWG